MTQAIGDTTRRDPHLGTITTDTGDFAPGPHTFARYTNPLFCLEAALHRRNLWHDSLAARPDGDTLRLTPGGDTLPASVVAFARACGERFTAAGATVPDLVPLFQLALLEQNDPLAHAVLQRRLALATTDAARRGVYLESLAGYLVADPTRLGAVDSLVAQVDASGRASLLTRSVIHLALLRFWQQSFDRAHLQQEAAHLIALAQQMPEADLKVHPGGWDALVAAYTNLVAMAFVDHPDSIPVLAQQFQQELRRPGWAAVLREMRKPDLAQAPIENVSDFLGRSANIDSTVGQLVQPIPARYWFHTGHSTVVPTPGQVSLILNNFDFRCLYSVENLFLRCNQDIVVRLRRWLRQYTPAGVTVTVVARIPRDSTGVLLQSAPAAAVAPTLRRYVQDYLALPMTVAVDTQSTRLEVPSPDGRRFYDPSAWEQRSCNPNLLQSMGLHPGCDLVLLVGRDGRLLYRGNSLDDPLLAAVLARAAGNGTPISTGSGKATGTSPPMTWRLLLPPTTHP